MFLGMGMYGATLVQIHFLKGQFVLPILVGTALAALTGVVVGFLVMRRRGVYFALLTAMMMIPLVLWLLYAVASTRKRMQRAS